MNKLSILMGVTALFIFSACEPTDVNFDCSNVTPTYTGTIKPILDSNCASSNCHSSSTKANNIDLSNYTSVSAEASHDRFMGSINHETAYSNMPQFTSVLSFSDRQEIHCWILNGKPQ